MILHLMILTISRHYEQLNACGDVGTALLSRIEINTVSILITEARQIECMEMDFEIPDYARKAVLGLLPSESKYIRDSECY